MPTHFNFKGKDLLLETQKKARAASLESSKSRDNLNYQSSTQDELNGGDSFRNYWIFQQHHYSLFDGSSN